MRPTQQRHDLGQSLWLDNTTRGLLKDGTLQRYISDFSVTGLTSNPTIFAKRSRSSERRTRKSKPKEHQRGWRRIMSSKAIIRPTPYSPSV